MSKRVKKIIKRVIPLTMAILLSIGIVQPLNVYASTAPVLSVTPNSSGNYMGLNWTMADSSQSYSYMLYSKEQSEGTYQSIPAKETVNVLNLYPANVSGTISFTNWKGQSFTLPASAGVKQWMEQPNSYDPKGFGKGLISVDAVSIEAFNTNPNAYLKDSNGNWKYDVVYEGAWDGNGFAQEDDYTTTAVSSIRSFINSGRGYLVGHDTIMYPAVWNTNTLTLRDLMNIKVRSGDAIASNVGDSTIQSSVRIKNKGLLTNYPWAIGDVGTLLTTPPSHTTGQVAYGTVWMDYPTYSGQPTDNNGQGNGNYYLETWNNTAMIQTGHSTGQASPDEQKVIANTLFYLAQITEATSWNDHKGQDVNNPNNPSISSVKANATNTQFTLNYNATDNGTTYNYYVESTGETNGVKAQSSIQTATITTGIKGYSILVDQNASTVPNGSLTTTSTSYTFNDTFTGNFYIHIASIDGAGNVSGTTTYLVDNTVPTLSVTPSTTAWTNGTVTLTATGLDSTSGMKSITLPNSNVVSGSSTTYTVGANGTYSFTATDNVGNNTTKSITVSNIDTTGATLNLSESTTAWTKQATINASATDTQSGVKSITLPNGTVVNGASASYPVTSNGTYSFTATDNVGNTTSKSISISNIDTTAPGMNFTQSTNQITNQSVTINASAIDTQSGVASITLPNGSVVNSSTASYTVTSNGTYNFQTKDNVGNIGNYSFTVSNIIEINTISGIDYVEYKLDGATVQDWTTYTAPVNVVNEGITNITARAVDKAGNVSDIATSIVKLDRSKPINGTIQIIIK